ncbi:hypothetical protein [[Eubacterium] cellulosolvens]
MNWSKGLTVKERILLHLLGYEPYSDSDEVPEAVTQQGIANKISAPRPHVSIALKDLRAKDQLTDRVCRVTHRSRKQKVYFLTSHGILQGKSLKHRLMESKITVLDGKVEEQSTIAKASRKYNLSLIELINKLTSTGVLDLTQSSAPQQPVSPGVGPEHTIGPTPTIGPAPTPVPTISKPPKPIQPPEIKSPTPMHFAPSRGPIPTGTDQPEQYDYISKTKQKYLEYLRDYYPEYYESYYTELVGPGYYKFTEKEIVGIFSLGYILMLLGAIAGLYWIITGEILYIIPLVILLTIGITVMGVSATRLWHFEQWQPRILNLLLLTCPVILYVTFFINIEPNLSYYDLGLWLIILFSCFALARFGTFIPLTGRAQALTALGIIIIINAVVSILIVTLTIYYAGFWLLSGILCIYLGQDLIQKQVEGLYLGIAIGLALGIVISCFYFVSIFNFNTAPGGTINMVIIILLWILNSIILFFQAYRSYITVELRKPTTTTDVARAYDNEKPNELEKSIKSLYAAIPIYIGIILVFFGMFLFRFDKVMETVVELFLGGVVILYGIQRLKGSEWSRLLLTGTVTVAVIYTLTSLLIL